MIFISGFLVGLSLVVISGYADQLISRAFQLGLYRHRSHISPIVGLATDIRLVEDPKKESLRSCGGEDITSMAIFRTLFGSGIISSLAEGRQDVRIIAKRVEDVDRTRCRNVVKNQSPT